MARHGMYPRDIVPPVSEYFASGRFGRLFGNLPPFSADTPTVRHALMEIGRPGGIMDAADDLAAGPTALIADPAKSAKNPNNPTSTAGMTFLGQFLDHDMTFDPTSSLERQVDPEHIMNFRTPSLGLDNVYGAGPAGSPHLYDQGAAGRGIRFLLEETGTPGRSDLPRNSQGVALIGDPRDDENLIVGQLQVAFLRFHNAVLDHVADTTGLADPGALFAEAQRLVRWHYQWIVVHEFLPRTCGQKVVDDVLANGRRHYKWRNEPFIPVEFAVAAYRFGHSQVRPSYRANFNMGGTPFDAMVFAPASPNPADPDDLQGSVRAPRRFIDWPTFFDFGDGRAKPNKKIDTILSTPLFQLPHSVVPHPAAMGNPSSLAQRNLLRHLTFSLPSGQRVAKAMKLPVLSQGDLADLKAYGMDDRTPLWFYILREAGLTENGERLGAVGARIVAEVFLGLLEGDKTSYLSQDPDWEPSLPAIDPSLTGEGFRMVDLLRFAGVA